MKPVRDYHRRLGELRAMETFPIQQERLIYPCPLNESKRRNLARQAVNRPLLKFAELSRPHILHVGVTTFCNLHCPACPTGTDSLGRTKEHLDFDLFCRTIDSLRGSLLFVLFWDWGEPFLHPKLPEMIEHAGRSGIRTVISTNGNVKWSDEKIEQLIRARPSTVVVCVDGADQPTYETYRRGGQLETVLQTISRLVDTRQRLEQSLPLIEFRSLATKGTEHQMPELLKLAQESGADLFSVKTLRPFDYRKAEVDGALVPENEALARYEYEGRKPDADARKAFVSEGPLTCGKPLYAPTLNSDGTLAFCSYAQQENEFFGNLKGLSFSNVWKNASSRFRRINFLQSGGTASCRTCYFRSEPAPTIIYQVPLRPLPDGIEVEAPQTTGEFLSQFG
jgi:MoaA/NifB/PqqE/SkfB family radical SAM enzyme